jgi:hypothetical protein
MNRNTISLLCAVLLIVGCGSSQSVKINEAARMEEETAENGSDGIQRAIESISLENRYDVEMARTMGNENEQSGICRPGITKRRETNWLRQNAEAINGRDVFRQQS